YLNSVPCFSYVYSVIQAPPSTGALCPVGTPNTLAAPCVRPYQFTADSAAPGGRVLYGITVTFQGFNGVQRACLEPVGDTVCTVYPPTDGVTFNHVYVTVTYGPTSFAVTAAARPA